MSHQLRFAHLEKFDPGLPGITVPAQLSVGSLSSDCDVKIDTGSSDCILSGGWRTIWEFRLKQVSDNLSGRRPVFFRCGDTKSDYPWQAMNSTFSPALPKTTPFREMCLADTVFSNVFGWVWLITKVFCM